MKKLELIFTIKDNMKMLDIYNLPINSPYKKKVLYNFQKSLDMLTIEQIVNKYSKKELTEMQDIIDSI